MKTKTILITLIAMLAVTAIVFQSCKKEKEKTNQKPTCEITAPTNGQEIKQGEVVTISVDTEDKDGTISEVRFFVDGVGKGSATSFPYNYEWNTNGESIGNHTIKSTGIDNNGGSTSAEISVTIIAGSSAPIANFTADNTNGTASLTVNFTDQSTNTPTTWHWDFGDGGSSAEQSPSHTYITDGTYTVSLTVTNSFGSDTESKTDYITVSGGSGNTPPTALFTVSPSSGTTSTNFAFDASGSTDNEEPTSNLQVRWDFDDNGSWDTGWDTDKTENHLYGNEGLYTAKLEVKDTEGLTDQYTKSITVTGTFTDPRDGQTYNIITIGSQTWFAENLNYETSNSWWYDNSSANGDIYGRLYTWEAALTACPSGWHLPTDDEWTILSNYLGGSDVAGGKMKETGTSHWNSPNTGATNSSGFTALPGGYRNTDGNFSNLGDYGYWWSATESGSNHAWGSNLYYNTDGVNSSIESKGDGFSVRCLRD